MRTGISLIWQGPDVTGIVAIWPLETVLHRNIDTSILHTMPSRLAP